MPLNKPSIALSTLSLSYEPSLSHHLHQFRRLSLSLNFSLVMMMVVVVVFNLSPLCIEKYFLSWHLLSWCWQSLNPFLLVCLCFLVICSSNSDLCCVWSMRFPKAPSLPRESEGASSSNCSNHRVNVVGCVKITAVQRWNCRLILEKNVSALMLWFPNCYYLFLCFLVRRCNPNKSWYPATNLPYNIAHPDTQRNRRRLLHRLP